MKWRLFLYFFGVFACFTAIVVVYQQRSERRYRESSLREQLDIYSTIAAHNPADSILPPELRITIIERSGVVRFDNAHQGTITDNHLLRPEIRQAKRFGSGWDIRQSATTEKTYYYYAVESGNGFVRVALPYNDHWASMLTADDLFLWIVGGLFLCSMCMLWFVARNFGRSVERLKSKIIREQNERSRLKTEMTSSIAHELRTPVSAIRAYTETLLSNDIPPQKARQFIERTAAASLRLTGLLSDVSILTKIEEAGDLLTREQVDLSALVAEVLDEQSGALKENSITVENMLPRGVVINGNRTLLYSIFRNLTENAIHHAGKWITLRVELIDQNDKFYHFSLSDTGVGIDNKEHLERIFERFYRSDVGRTRSDQSIGSGLGLSIVRHAVLFHNGQIRAINGANGGLRFEFSLAK